MSNQLENYTSIPYDRIEHTISLDEHNTAYIIKRGKNNIGYILNFSSSKSLKKLVKDLVETFNDKYKKGIEIFFAVPIKDPDFEAKLYQVIKYGFCNPGIPTGGVPEFVISTTNEKSHKSFMHNVHIKNVKSVLEDFYNWNNRKNIPCSISVQVEESTKKKLSNWVHSGKKSGDHYQEYSGVFSVKDIYYRNKSSVYVLSFNKEYMMTGDNNSVDGVDKCFTFHTHPLGEYKKIQVEYAWPSKSDIHTVYQIITNGDGVLHILASLEGLYYISINPSWANRISELVEKCDECLKIYEIPYPSNRKDAIATPEEYVKKVNTPEAPFRIQFRAWEDDSPVVVSSTRYIENDIMYCKCEL